MLKKFVNQFVREEEGATMVEYAIMVALIAVFCIAAVRLLGNQVGLTFDTASDQLPQGDEAYTPN